jgi:hypothetical protein
MATKMKMVMKGGKKVPAFAADGKGKMKMGGVKMKKYDTGGGTDPATGFEKRQARKIAKAKTKAEIAAIEGEGTVANKRKNLATNIATGLGTIRGKVPKSLSTSNSTSNSITKDSGNTSTYNNTSSGSSSGSSAGAVAGANADADANSSSTINPMPRRTPGKITPRPSKELRRGASMQKGGFTKAIKPKMKVGGSTTKKYLTGGPTSQSKPIRPKDQPQPLKKARYGSTMKPTMMKKGGTKKK